MNPAAQQGASLTLYSHNGVVKFGITTDIVRVERPEEIVKFFEDTLEEMLNDNKKELTVSDFAIINPE